ncbi:MAG: hypothetical protein ABEJ05_05070 [Haloglomus sp.]
MDVPRSFALAVLAIVAVASQYTVDALFAWEAGVNPGTPASENVANLALFGLQFLPCFQTYEGLVPFSAASVVPGLGCWSSAGRHAGS